MKKTSKLEAAIIRELRCRGGLVSIPAMVEDYGVEVKDVLWTMRRERKVRLVAIGDRSQMTSEELHEGCIEGDNETFAYAEMAG